MVDPKQLEARIESLRSRVRSVMEEPSAQAVADVYADAFLNAAGTTGVEDALEEFSSFLDDVLARFPEFEALLFSGIVGRDEKLRIIERVVAPRASELFTNFLRVLARHGRLDLLPLILKKSRSRWETRQGRGRVRVISAHPLSEDWQTKIHRRLDEVLPFDPIIENRVDRSLVGGLIIQVGDTVYDSSLRARLKQLRARLRQRSLNEIQSGRDRFSSPEGD